MNNPDLASSAAQAVSLAVRKGKLPRLDGSIPCVDCGKAAHHYDHRDYAKPLDVQPVCGMCNHKRGAARNHPTTLATKRGGLFLRLNIIDPNNLYIAEFVQREARKQCRTTANQVIWMLGQYIKQHMQENDDG